MKYVYGLMFAMLPGLIAFLILYSYVPPIVAVGTAAACMLLSLPLGIHLMRFDTMQKNLLGK